MTYKPIRVHVVKHADCRNLTLRYKDPRTGKYHRKAATTPNRKEARKEAAVWESELNSGKSPLAVGSIAWQEFRTRYENEQVPSLAEKTADKIATVLNVLEKVLPVVAKGRLRDLTADRLSELQRDLRKRGRAESTIAGHLAHLRAALAWAVDMDLLAAVPKIRRPKRAKRSGATSPMKGRPITGEEFERMIAAVPKALQNLSASQKPRPTKRPRKPDKPKKDPPAATPAVVESWRHLLHGLYWSGLRLGESLELYWDRPDRPCVDLTGRRPMLRIPAAWEKGHRDRVLPMAPEFAEFLRVVPESDRRGRVFRPLSKAGTPITPDRVSKVVGLIGRQAGVKVHVHPTTGAVKYASAHDLRRSFGERWSTRVMPQVLMALMRHESIQTTMRFCVGRNAQTTADAAWAAYEGESGGISAVLSAVGPDGQEMASGGPTEVESPQGLM